MTTCVVTRWIDNIDYDPTTTAPYSVLHGTSISKLQHFIYGRDNTLKPNVFDRKMGSNTAKHLPTSLDAPLRRRNQLHLQPQVLSTSPDKLSHVTQNCLYVPNAATKATVRHPVIKVLSKRTYPIAGVKEMLTCIPELNEHLFATAKL